MIPWLHSRTDVPGFLKGAIVALGNFDGFHQGHQAVINAAIAWAKAERRACIVATFDPHPTRYFASNAVPFSLSTLEQRREWFTAAGADAMLVLHFDATLAACSPDDWVKNFLHKKMAAAGIVTGTDFAFGRNKSGDVASLHRICSSLGLGVLRVAPIEDSQGAISSSRIRHALRRGDCEMAAQMLTRPFTILGHIEQNDQAVEENRMLNLGAYVRPTPGTYAVTGRLSSGRQVEGRAILGARASGTAYCPAFRLDFSARSADMTGQKIELRVHRLMHSTITT